MEERHDWAGEAALRTAPGEREVVGFLQLDVHCREGLPYAWSGTFEAPATKIALALPSPVELLLPRHVVARAILGGEQDSLYAVAGLVPWPEWRDLAGPPTFANSFVQREGFIEAAGPSSITLENWVPADNLPLAPGQRLLLDYRPVTQIRVPIAWFVKAGETMQAMGLKVAIVASSPVAFGISRQAILTAALDEDRGFRVFRDYDAAVRWLLA